MEVLARISDILLPGIPRTQRKACQRALTPARSTKLQQPGTLMRRELGRPVISFHSKTYPPEITRVATTVPFGHYRSHRFAARGAVGIDWRLLGPVRVHNPRDDGRRSTLLGHGSV